MVAHFSVTRLTWKSLGTFDFKAFEHFCAKEKEIVQQFGFGWRPVVYLGVGRKMGQLGKNLPIRVVKCEEQSKEMMGTPTRLSITFTKMFLDVQKMYSKM